MRLPTFIDLSHTIDENIPTWTGDCGYACHNVTDYGGDLFRTQEVKLFTSSGTHMDAPSHLFKGRRDTAAFEINELFAPAVVIDIREKVALDEEYALSPEDIEIYEARYGAIPEDSLLIALTGWDKRWRDKESYRNLDAKGVMRFPRISIEALRAVKVPLRGVAIDTLSPDGGDVSLGFPVHEFILGQGGFILENLANLEALPPNRAYILALPVKLAGATEAPVRAVGLIL